MQISLAAFCFAVSLPLSLWPTMSSQAWNFSSFCRHQLRDKQVNARRWGYCFHQLKWFPYHQASEWWQQSMDLRTLNLCKRAWMWPGLAWSGRARLISMCVLKTTHLRESWKFLNQIPHTLIQPSYKHQNRHNWNVFFKSNLSKAQLTHIG